MEAASRVAEEEAVAVVHVEVRVDGAAVEEAEATVMVADDYGLS